MLLLLMAILSKAQGSSGDNQIQSYEHPGSIQPSTPPLSHHHGVSLEAFPLVGVLNLPSSKMFGR